MLRADRSNCHRITTTVAGLCRRVRDLLAMVLLVGVLSCLLGADGGPTVSADSRSVPAEFIQRLSPPGSADDFSRPAAIRVDRHFDEILVADSGNNRIVIFDGKGTFRFAFNGEDIFTTPTDLAIDSEGYIYVLATTNRGRRIFRFDFDGLYVGEVPIPEALAGRKLDIRSLAVDAQDRLCLLDHAALQVCTFTIEGQLVSSLLLAADLDPKSVRELVLGSLTVDDERIFVPFASLGTVRVYNRDGDLLRSLGFKGNNIGQLNFPVAVAVTEEDLVMVLDKRRFNVVCFDLEGQFLGEFGGRGISPGWFYHPSLLAVDREGQVYVGQIFENKIQVCGIPDFIRAGRLRGMLQPG